MSLPANTFAKAFQRTTSVMMEQQTKESQAKHHHSTTALDSSYSIATTSSSSNTTDVGINELGTCTGNYVSRLVTITDQLSFK